MARLHEHQGKEILRRHGIHTPSGVSIHANAPVPDGLPLPAVIKAQAWTTSRFAKGLISFASTGTETEQAIASLLSREVDGFPIEEVLVEEQLEIDHEYFFSYYIDDDAGVARYLFAAAGGSGVEEALANSPSAIERGTVDTWSPVHIHSVREVVRRAGVHGRDLLKLSDVVLRAIQSAIDVEARSLEINPIVRTTDGRYLAADCRVTVDDYAVFRHPELDIEIARDLSNPPTPLDRIAYSVEQNDFRGTFYFTQLARSFSPRDRYVGFHGAGGGGSMMSMDALAHHNFHAANYCDTSGNPPASKVYRAARIIASQPGIVGYFGSGSGVASQEQVHSARGLVKAFCEINMDLPVAIRLGGNLEEEAIHILEHYTRHLSAKIRGFGKDTEVTRCVAELDKCVTTDVPSRRSVSADPAWLEDDETYTFQSPTGSVHYHHPTCLECASKACVSSCVPGILAVDGGKPVLAISKEEASAGKCIECLACEVECREHGNAGGFVSLPIAGLDDISGLTEGTP